MLRLLVLRHSKAEKARLGGDDHARPLDATGRSDASRIGAYMAKHGLRPACALVSSASRTRETWDLVGAQWPGIPVQVERDLYEAAPDQILTVLHSAPVSANEVIIVGHNPGLHDFAAWLTGEGEEILRGEMAEGLPTSGLVVIDFYANAWSEVTPGSGRMAQFITPKSLPAA